MTSDKIVLNFPATSDEIADADRGVAKLMDRVFAASDHVHILIEAAEGCVTFGCTDVTARFEQRINLPKSGAAARRQQGKAIEEQVLEEYERFRGRKLSRSRIVKKIADKEEIKKTPRHVSRILRKFGI